MHTNRRRSSATTFSSTNLAASASGFRWQRGALLTATFCSIIFVCCSVTLAFSRPIPMSDPSEVFPEPIKRKLRVADFKTLGALSEKKGWLQRSPVPPMTEAEINDFLSSVRPSGRKRVRIVASAPKRKRTPEVTFTAAKAYAKPCETQQTASSSLTEQENSAVRAVTPI